jgi:hypothetical protein
LRFGSGLASAAVPGYYQPSLAGLVCGWFWQRPAFERFDLSRAIGLHK